MPRSAQPARPSVIEVAPLRAGGSANQDDARGAPVGGGVLLDPSLRSPTTTPKSRAGGLIVRAKLAVLEPLERGDVRVVSGDGGSPLRARSPFVAALSGPSAERQTHCTFTQMVLTQDAMGELFENRFTVYSTPLGEADPALSKPGNQEHQRSVGLCEGERPTTFTVYHHLPSGEAVKYTLFPP
jgi:hypothetical protein